MKGDLYASHRVGPWGLSVAGSVFDFDGYPLVAASQRGTVDMAAFSRHQALRLYNEWAPAGGSWAGSLEAGLLNEHRGNGTPLQTNDTVSYDFSATAQWSASPRDRLETRAFLRRTIFQSNFTAVAANRNSERLTTQQHVPSADGGASLLWYATRGRHQITAGTDLWVVSGASTENVFAGLVVGSIRVGSGKQATTGFFAEENYAISSRTALVVGGRVDLWKNFDGQQGSFPPGSRQLAALEGTTLAVLSPRAGLTHELTPRFSL